MNEERSRRIQAAHATGEPFLWVLLIFGACTTLYSVLVLSVMRPGPGHLTADQLKNPELVALAVKMNEESFFAMGAMLAGVGLIVMLFSFYGIYEIRRARRLKEHADLTAETD
jgi:hypothetical protein